MDFINRRPFKIRGINGLVGWKAQAPAVNNNLCFTAKQANSTVKLTKQGSPYEISLETSTDGTTWTAYTIDTTITLANIGDKVYFRGDNEHFSMVDYDCYQFVMTGSINASGNIMSLLGEDNQLTTNCFIKLFSDCTSLITAPELPATTLAHGCYEYMFSGCTSLITAPELPATTLANWCYTSMFGDCTSLTTAPELPATTLANWCYTSMFEDCTSLTTTPELPATTLANGCYNGMFIGCTSLNSIKIAHMGNFSNDYFYNWVDNISATGDFYYNGTDTTRGASAIPEGWTVHTFD